MKPSWQNKSKQVCESSYLFSVSKVVERLGHVGDSLHHLRELRLEDPGAELLLELVWVPPPDRLTDGALDGCRVLAISGGRIKIKWTSTIQETSFH